MTPQTFIFIGCSGCGKGTQGKLLEDHLKSVDSNRPVFYNEMGVLFREFITGEKYSHQLSKVVYEEGRRQPDFLAVTLWAKNFIEKLTGEEHLIIDGTPRSLREAEVLDTAISFYNMKTNVVFIDVSRECATKRLLSRGRSDDVNTDKINKRLDWFEKDVVPAVEYYRNNKNYNFIHIDGNKPISDVQKDIIDHVGSLE